MKQASNILNPDDEQAVKDAESYYLNNVGNVETTIDSNYEAHILNDLAECFISPLQSIVDDDGTTYYGVIDYQKGDEWYGFEVYNGRSRNERRVVGVRELQNAEQSSDLPHATAGDKTGSFAKQPNATYSELASGMDAYYEDKYGTDRNTVSISYPYSVKVLR